MSSTLGNMAIRRAPSFISPTRGASLDGFVGRWSLVFRPASTDPSQFLLSLKIASWLVPYVCYHSCELLAGFVRDIFSSFSRDRPNDDNALLPPITIMSRPFCSPHQPQVYPRSPLRLLPPGSLITPCHSNLVARRGKTLSISDKT